jgi:hypothetical protein
MDSSKIGYALGMRLGARVRLCCRRLRVNARRREWGSAGVWECGGMGVWEYGSGRGMSLHFPKRVWKFDSTDSSVGA